MMQPARRHRFLCSIATSAIALTLYTSGLGGVIASAGDVGSLLAVPTGAQVWHRIAVMEEDNSRAGKIGASNRVLVTLPDRSSATLRVNDRGQPRALMFPKSNTLASRRARALEAGGTVSSDRSISLPAVTERGRPIDVLIRADGVAMATTP